MNKDSFEKFEEAIEELGWSITFYGENGIVIETWSPAGENIFIDTTLDDFIKDVRDECEGFDVDDHVELWIDGRGKNGVPGSIKELLDDAREIESMLEGLNEAVENTISFEDCPSMRIGDMLRFAAEHGVGMEAVMRDVGAGSFRELMQMIADAIDACYLPIPLTEDGYPIQRGTKTRYGEVESFEVYEDGDWLVRFEGQCHDFIEGTLTQRIALTEE